MESRYIKLDYLDALESKKSLLGAEINFLQLIKKIKNYRVLRMKELNDKNKFRSELIRFRKAIDSVQKVFPEENIKEDKRKNKEKKILSDNKDLEEELNQIKKKLARLGRK